MTEPDLPARFEDLFPGPGMDLWCCLGATTDRSVRLWLRSARPETFVASLCVEGAEVATGAVRVSTAHDGVQYVDLTPEEPMPGMPFTVSVAGMERHGSFAPEPGKPEAFSFVFGSCNQPFMRGDTGAELSASGDTYERMVQVARANRTSFSLLVGDQAYADGVAGLSVPGWARSHPDTTDEELVSLYRQVYHSYFSHPGFESLLALQPSYLIWDDHEIFDAWGSHESRSRLDERLFVAGRQAYVEYQHTHNPGATLEAAAPFHYSFDKGNVGFFVFDLRSERDYRSKSLIGEAQWTAFEAFLAAATENGTPTVFVVSTIPLVHFSPGLIRLLDNIPGRKSSLMRERWDSEGFRHHRERMLDLLFGWQSARPNRKVILLSGDVHSAAAIDVRQRDAPGAFRQWTSSALCTPTGLAHTIANRAGVALINWGEKRCQSRVVGLEPDNNFGLVQVTPAEPGNHEVRLAVYKYGSRQSSLKKAIVDNA